MGDSWYTPQLRESVVKKLWVIIADKSIPLLNNPPFSTDAFASAPGPGRSGVELENHVFQKAQDKDQYLAFVARLILHVRDLSE